MKRRQLEKEVAGATKSIMSQALNFRFNSMLQREIRVHAVNVLNGVVMIDEPMLF